MITRMFADIMFDREIDPKKHYISPGGYEIMSIDGDLLQFDFEDYIGNVDQVNKHVLHVEHSNLDLSAFPDAVSLEQFLHKFKCFTDFFVYTGETCEPEIKPVKAFNIVFVDRYGDQQIISTEYIFPKAS